VFQFSNQASFATSHSSQPASVIHGLALAASLQLTYSLLPEVVAVVLVTPVVAVPVV
jgi:hypothetical protein